MGLLDKPIIVFDVESVGLHGEGFAVAGVLLVDGRVSEEFGFACPPDAARGGPADRDWVASNVTLDGCIMLERPEQVRNLFWSFWNNRPGLRPHLLADCCWPVEANFLSACIHDDLGPRWWSGPYPLLDLAPLMLASGADPTVTTERLPDELPAHNPLCDARQSARLLITVDEWLKRITPKPYVTGYKP